MTTQALAVVSGAQRWAVEHGSMLEVLRGLPDEAVDSCVCDPPYEIGFMGREWDRSGIAFCPETWTHVFRVLKPGGHLLAFGGTRTAHRIACAIEDAAFDIRDSIAWLYGSGFPKSLNVGKAIDEAAGAVRAVVGSGPYAARRVAPPAPNTTGEFGFEHGGHTLTAPATDAAKQWDGWGTALKPANEPIIVGRKPFRLTVADNVQAFGTGAINVDACRVETGPSGDGRWPPNTVLTHSAACRVVGSRTVRANPTWNTPNRDCASTFTGETVSEVRHVNDVVRVYECAPDCPVRELDDQSGETTSSAHSRGAGLGYGGRGNRPATIRGTDDTGTASRFFPQSQWHPALDDVAPFLYAAKASRGERDQAFKGEARNSHPTVKPVELLRWLVRLVTPPKGIVLDPFAGSGSCGVASMLEGFRYLGIELNDTDAEPFASIARARIEWVIGGGYQDTAAPPPTPSRVVVAPVQQSLFALRAGGSR